MSNFYDPWAHAVQLFLARVIQFLGLTLPLALAAWVTLLHWYFPDSSWIDLARFTWDIVLHGNRHWRGVFVLCMMIAGILVGWLFTTVTLRSRLQNGDRYHRGSRVLRYEQD